MEIPETIKEKVLLASILSVLVKFVAVSSKSLSVDLGFLKNALKHPLN